MTRQEIEAELSRLISEEESIDHELRDYFNALSGGKSVVTFDSSDLSLHVKKVEEFAPCFEAMVQDSRKLSAQLDDCRALSDRLSVIVRRLDNSQMRAQQALACTEDVINLKECKFRMAAAVEEGNLPLAVSYIRQVHDIDMSDSKSHEDYIAMKQAESEVRVLVETEFSRAIESSNISSVMNLCPLLQTLGLEAQARDNFLTFIEKTVFIAVSADAAAVDGATDPATGYAQALSNVFNSVYLILQQYLPMVITGLENSLGDVHFIRRLHAKCEREAGLVLKRYMKYRNVKEMVTSLKLPSRPGAGVLSGDLHVMLDELALLLQYCCMYSKYIKNLCRSAEARKRSNGTGASHDAAAVMVFPGPTEFDKMIDELANRYYMEGEQWLMRTAVREVMSSKEQGQEQMASVDECFFVLQRCGQRSLATNNIHAACAVLHLIADLLSTEMLQQAQDVMASSLSKVQQIVSDNITRLLKPAAGSNGDSATSSSSQSASLSQGFHNAISLASSITGGGSTVAVSSSHDSNTLHAGEKFPGDESSDPWGLSAHMEVFRMLELIARYIERLTVEAFTSGQAIFASAADCSALAAHAAAIATDNSSNNYHSHHATSSAMVGKSIAGGRYHPHQTQPVAPSLSSDMEKIKLCQEDFATAKHNFLHVVTHSQDKLITTAHGLISSTIASALGQRAVFGAIKFDMADDVFDNQPQLALLPRALVEPAAALLQMCTCNLSESSRGVLIDKLAAAWCDGLEQFVCQTKFRFTGALRVEECVRAVSASFAREISSGSSSMFSSSSGSGSSSGGGSSSSSLVRTRFCRLREVMMILTSDVTAGGLPADHFSSLSSSEVASFLALRVDYVATRY